MHGLSVHFCQLVLEGMVGKDLVLWDRTSGSATILIYLFSYLFTDWIEWKRTAGYASCDCLGQGLKLGLVALWLTSRNNLMANLKRLATPKPKCAESVSQALWQLACLNLKGNKKK